MFGALERSEAVERALVALPKRRRTRVRPGLDDKVLAEWNGLMLATLAEAAAVLDRADWMEAARQAGAFLVGSLRRDDGRWMRSWQVGTTSGRHRSATSPYAGCDRPRPADALLDLFWDDERGNLHHRHRRTRSRDPPEGPDGRGHAVGSEPHGGLFRGSVP